MTAWLPVALGLVALLYATVGHAGATGYIAVMTLFGLEPAVVRPTALVLNVVVASIATAQFARAGHFRPRLFLPLATASVPCAVAGGAVALPLAAFEALVGVVLLVSAALTVLERRPQDDAQPEPPWLGVSGSWLGVAVLALVGAAIGLLSGLTGVGGGVFLTPVLLAARTAPVKSIAAITAPFILVNSLAGLVGGLLAGRPPTVVAATFVVAVVIGGVVGAQLGAFRLPSRTLRVLMAVVLVVAGVKLLVTAVG